MNFENKAVENFPICNFSDVGDVKGILNFIFPYIFSREVFHKKSVRVGDDYKLAQSLHFLEKSGNDERNIPLFDLYPEAVPWKRGDIINRVRSYSNRDYRPSKRVSVNFYSQLWTLMLSVSNADDFYGEEIILPEDLEMRFKVSFCLSLTLDLENMEVNNYSFSFVEEEDLLDDDSCDVTVNYRDGSCEIPGDGDFTKAVRYSK